MSSCRHSLVDPNGHDGRKIGYAVTLPKGPLSDSAAIVHFVPLSGCAAAVEPMQDFLKQNLTVAYLVVDRPDMGTTGPAAAPSNRKESLEMSRVSQHTQDVIAVLQHLKISKIFLLGVCLGHPYAVHLARHLLAHQDIGIEVHGLTLVAPFCGPACPDSFWVARYGNACCPSWCIGGFGSFAKVVSAQLMPHVVTPHALEHKLLHKKDEWPDGGWTSEDCAAVCEWMIICQTQELSSAGWAMECRLGASKEWQGEILDGFWTTLQQCSKSDQIPIVIYACNEDKVAPLASVKWVAQRCYGWTPDTKVGTNGAKLRILERIHSHEVMTVLGGPPRNPVLLKRIAKDWGVSHE